jgi:hypothetical protein
MALVPFDDGTGPALYAAGVCQYAQGTFMYGVSKWNGAGWSLLGAVMNGTITSLCSYDDGSGAALYAGGWFTTIGGVAAPYIARWDGTNWSAPGGGMSGYVEVLRVHDDGTGPALVAGGSFTTAGSMPAAHIAKWDGATWIPLAAGTNGTVKALADYDDGSGPKLFAAGGFTMAGGIGTSGIARWDGANWAGLPGTFSGSTYRNALATFEDGSGPALYVAGAFDDIGGLLVHNIARWNGVTWSALGAGITSPSTMPTIYALSVVKDSSGSALYAGGDFHTAGGLPAEYVARWDGSGWSALGSGTFYYVNALTSFDDGSGPALIAGGPFMSCPDSGDSYVAKWGLPPPCVHPGDVVCEPGQSGTTTCPCANPPSGVGLGCDNSSFTGGAHLAASGAVRISNDTLVLTSGGEKPSALSIVLQSRLLGPAGVTFGQGVRCTTGAQQRLYAKTAVAGSISAPGVGDPSVSARSAALGAPIAQGSHRYYGVYYRDPIVLGGCPSTSTFNITQQLDILWFP